MFQRQIPFVDDDDQPRSHFDDLPGELLVQARNAGYRIDNKKTNVRTLHRFVRAQSGKIFQGIKLVLGTFPGGVNQLKRRSFARFFVRIIQTLFNRVARRSRDIADNQTGIFRQSVPERTFSDVRAPRQANTNRLRRSRVGIYNVPVFVLLNFRKSDFI